MANMLAMGLDPVQAAIRQRINTGEVIPTEPVVSAPQAQGQGVPSPEFAQPMSGMPQQPPTDLTAAIRSRIMPQAGQTRVFPNGRVGRHDGTGWVAIG